MVCRPPTSTPFPITPLFRSASDRRASAIAAKYPYFVALENGRAVGYAYLDAFSPRAAYAPTADVSVYLSPAAHRRGIGRALVAKLEEAGRETGIRTLISVITSENGSSRAFHEAVGFREVTYLPALAEKFGKSLGVYYYRKDL